MHRRDNNFSPSCKQVLEARYIANLYKVSKTNGSNPMQ